MVCPFCFAQIYVLLHCTTFIAFGPININANVIQAFDSGRYICKIPRVQLTITWSYLSKCKWFQFLNTNVSRKKKQRNWAGLPCESRFGWKQLDTKHFGNDMDSSGEFFIYICFFFKIKMFPAIWWMAWKLYNEFSHLTSSSQIWLG